MVLIDERAQTNTPGSEREKRWQDVEALLMAGITVLSTVNVQHLESLNDIDRRVRERIPDVVLSGATEPVLVRGAGWREWGSRRQAMLGARGPPRW